MSNITLNMDIASLVRYLDRYIIELMDSTSSSTTDVRNADKIRLTSYIDALKKRKLAIFDQPELDCPKTNRVSYELPELPEIKPMDNDMIKDVIELLVMIRQEVAQAPGSVNMPNGYTLPDSIRFDVYVTKLEQYVATFLEPVEPLDLPETSPSAPPT